MGSYLAARAAGKLRDNATAAALYGRTLELDPGNALILERTFLLELITGNNELAQRLARRVTNQDRKNRLARISLGLRDFKAGRFKGARGHWKLASHGAIGQLTAALLTAWSYTAEKKTRAALGALEVLRNTEAFGIYRTFHSALIADIGGQKQKALALYQKAYATAGPSLRVVQTYGNFLQRIGQRGNARKIYQDYIKSSNSHPLISEALNEIEAGRRPKAMIPSASTGAAEALFGIASALAEESGIDFAILYSQMALDLKPDFPISLTLLGDIYEDAKRYDEAIETYNRIPQGSPLYRNAQTLTALDLDHLDRPDEAREVLSALIETYPDSFQPAFTMTSILRRRSRFEEASAFYSRAIDHLPEITARHWTVFYFRGICYERSGQWEKAEADFRQALKLNPEQPLVLNYLGHSLMEKGLMLDEAFVMVQKAAELRPTDGYIIDSLGSGYYLLGRYDEAVAAHERAVMLRPADPINSEHYGDALLKTGRIREASHAFRWALQLDPPMDKIEGLKAKLARAESTLPSGSADIEIQEQTQSEAVAETTTEPTTTQTSARPVTDEKALGKRVALVIGNSIYDHAPRLRNPKRDAEAIASALTKLGFSHVSLKLDLKRDALVEALLAFSDKANTADWAVVYFAGHGLEMDGTNYLVPVDARLERGGHVRFEAVGLEDILESVRGAKKFRLAILDACRNNPFINRMQVAATRSVGRGLARVEPAGGTLVAYAARHGQLATDGDGENSPFASALLEHIQTEGLEINLLFRRVRDSVLKSTGQSQEPFTYGSLPSEGLYFKPSPD